LASIGSKLGFKSSLPPSSLRSRRRYAVGIDQQFGQDAHHVPPKKKTGTAKLRTWRVSILRNRVQFLGFVKAPDRQAAEAAAAKQFNISEEQRTRLVVQERD
jgi:hypothetical protein